MEFSVKNILIASEAGSDSHNNPIISLLLLKELVL